jgi:hypothetical protein
MSLKSLSLMLAVQPLLASAVLAAGYVSNFDDISGNASLSDADGWVTNDPFNPGTNAGQTDFVGILSGYSQTVTDHWALLGGATGFSPGQPTIYLSRPVDLSGSASVSFTTGMAVISSAVPRPNEDTFGWTFRNNLDVTLFSLLFDPNTAVNGDLAIRIYDSSNVEIAGAGSGSWSMFYNAIYSLDVSVNSLGVVDVNFTDANSITTQVINGASTGIDPGDIAGVAATWILDDNTENPTGVYGAFGSNSLVFDNYSLVPEPSSALLLGLAAFGFVTRRRRA